MAMASSASAPARRSERTGRGLIGAWFSLDALLPTRSAFIVSKPERGHDARGRDRHPQGQPGGLPGRRARGCAGRTHLRQHAGRSSRTAGLDRWQCRRVDHRHRGLGQLWRTRGALPGGRRPTRARGAPTALAARARAHATSGQERPRRCPGHRPGDPARVEPAAGPPARPEPRAATLGGGPRGPRGRADPRAQPAACRPAQPAAEAMAPRPPT